MMNNKKFGLWLNYSLIFFLIGLVILSPYYFQNKSLIHRYDAFQQHIVAIKNIRILLGEIFSGSFSLSDFWSWNVGIGADQFQIYSYYGMGDIFTYIGLLFKNYDTTFLAIMVSKLYVAGLGMLFFLKSKDNFSDWSILGGVFTYLVCGYTIHSSTTHPMFLTPIVILPFFLISIDRLFKRKKSFLISVVLAWSLISNFYFSVFVILAGAVYFFILLFKLESLYLERWKMVFNVILKLVLGICLSAIFLVPTLYAFLHSTRAEVPFANGTVLYPLKFYINFFSTFVLPPSNRSFEFHGTYALITIPAICYVFMNFKRYKDICIALILLGVGFLSPIFAAAVNGLSTPSLRWEFLLGVPLSIGTAVFIDSLDKISRKQYIAISIISICFVILASFREGLTKSIDPYILFLLLITISLLALFRFSKFGSEANNLVKKFVLCIVLFNVSFSGFYYNSKFGVNYAAGHIDNNSVDKLYENYLFGLSPKLKKMVANNNFMRVSTTRRAKNPNLGSAINNRANVGAWSEIPMLNSYFSLQNENLGNFSNYYQNSDMVMTEPLRNLDNRTILSNFLGVKYLISKEKNDVPLGYRLKSEEKFNGESIFLYESDYSFPLLYGIDRVTSINNTENGIIREKLLTQSVAIDEQIDKSIFDSYEKIIPLSEDVEEVPLKINKDKSAYRLELSNDHIILDEDNYEYYLQISNPTVQYSNFIKNIENRLDKKSEEDSSLLDAIKEESRLTPAGSTIRINQGDKLLNLKYIYGTHEPSSFVSLQTMLFNIGSHTQNSLSRNPLTVQFISQNPIEFKNIKLFRSKISNDTLHQMKEIQVNKLEDVKISNGLITAKSTFSGKKIVASSIPFSEGWKIKVDDKNVNSFIVNEGFLGFEIKNSGKHSVKIVYETPYLKISMLLSFLSFILLVILKISLTNFKTMKMKY